MTGRKKDDKMGAPVIPFEQLKKLLEEQRRLAHYGEDRPALTDARPPEQPPSGPGGASHSHEGVTGNLYGEGSLGYWLFEPRDPRPGTAPLVIFLHGWGGGSPARFGAWIEHLVKRGKIVVFPLYQGSLQPWARPWERTSPTEMLENATKAVREAIKRLNAKESHVRPDLDRVAVVGFSAGGALAAQMAATAAKSELPVPKAVMPVAAGRGVWARRPLPSVDLGVIAPSTFMAVVVCADDKNAAGHEGKAIFTNTPQIPPENKSFIVVSSDYHGNPPLVANHNSPAASSGAYQIEERNLPPASALHYYGYWKLFDGLTDAAFYGKNREYALGNTPQLRFMGLWSDGVPVKELHVLARPELIGSGSMVRFRFRMGKDR